MLATLLTCFFAISAAACGVGAFGNYAMTKTFDENVARMSIMGMVFAVLAFGLFQSIA